MEKEIRREIKGQHPMKFEPMIERSTIVLQTLASKWDGDRFKNANADFKAT